MLQVGNWKLILSILATLATFTTAFAGIKYDIPMMDISKAHENERGANIVAVGAAVGASDILTRQMMIEGIESYFSKHGKSNSKNIAVFNEGYDLAREELAE